MVVFAAYVIGIEAISALLFVFLTIWVRNTNPHCQVLRIAISGLLILINIIQININQYLGFSFNELIVPVLCWIVIFVATICHIKATESTKN